MSIAIQIEQIKDGMILSETLSNSFGQTLIPSGTILNERHIRILKTWNIFTISIRSNESDEDSKLSEELRAKAMEVLNQRLNWEPRNIYEEDLVNLGIIHIAKKRFKIK